MAQAKRDQNSVPTLLAVSYVDGVTPVVIYADPVTHRLLVDLPAGGSGTPGGSDTQVQFNNAGAFGGISTATYDGTNLTILDANFVLADDGDTTKKLKFQLSSIATATTRTITVPDASGTVTLLGNTSTGSGSIVLATSPTLVTPVLGVATATSINKVAFTAPTTGSTLTIADGKTLTVSNSLTLAGTDGTTITFQGTDIYVGRTTTDTLTNKTLTTPTIASFVNATHTHQNAAGGGTLDAAAIAAGTVATARLGSGTANSTTFLRGDQTWATPSGGGGAFWSTVPGTPVRSSNTVFTITDTGNAGAYDLLLARGTVLKWTDTTTKQAMVVSAAYASNTVTVTIMGDTLSGTATMNTLKYGAEKARVITSFIAGTIGSTANDVTARFYAPFALHVFGARAYHANAGTTNATTYNISKNASGGSGTILAADLSIASAGTVSADQTATSGTTLATDDYLTLNITGVSTTGAVDAYVNSYVTPDANQYLT